MNIDEWRAVAIENGDDMLFSCTEDWQRERAEYTEIKRLVRQLLTHKNQIDIVSNDAEYIYGALDLLEGIVNNES
jgi:hypothetical protein